MLRERGASCLARCEPGLTRRVRHDLCTSLRPADPMTTLVVDTDVRVPTRDGLTLATTLFRPAGPGRWPAVLMRTPYDRTSYASETLQVHASALASAGYAVALQDVRGRGASDGHFSPFVNEQADGIDTVEWLADQAWCNGEIGLAGISYNAFAQTALATTNHQSVRCWVPGLTPSDVRTSWIRRNGILELGFHLSWALGGIASADGRIADLGGMLQAYQDPTKTARRGPVDQPELQAAPAAKWFFEWVESEDPYPNTDAVPTLGAVSSISVPALVVAGWYDVFSSGSIELFETLQRASPEGAHRLVAGPWDHSGLPLGRRAGDRDFGLSAVIDLHDLQLRWFDQHLRGGDEVEHDCLFVTGTNEWLSEAWRPPTDDQALYLTEGGELTRDLTTRGSIEVVIDTQDPTPVVGGTTFPWEPVLRPGAFDQSRKHRRSDVIVFATPPLRSSLVIAGSVTLEIPAELPTAHTPVVATLIEIQSGGQSWNVSDGFGLVDPATGIASFDLGPICHRFSLGSRLALDVAFAADVRIGPATSGPCIIDFSQGPASLTIPVMV